MKRYVDKVWLDRTMIHILTKDGLVATSPIERWPRLAAGTDEQRQDFYLSYCGIHWPTLDEDLTFEGLFALAGLCEHTPTENSVCYEAEPEEFDLSQQIVADE